MRSQTKRLNFDCVLPRTLVPILAIFGSVLASSARAEDNLNPSPAPSSAPPSCYLAETEREDANLRKAPDLKAESVARARKGETFPVQAVAGEESWSRITEGPRQGLYLHLSVVRVRFRLARPECSQESGSAEVSANRVNVRQSPSTDSPVAGKLNPGDPLNVTPAKGSWLKISWPEEFKDKYIREDFVRLRLPMALSD